MIVELTRTLPVPVHKIECFVPGTMKDDVELLFGEFIKGRREGKTVFFRECFKPASVPGRIGIVGYQRAFVERQRSVR